MSTTKAWSSRSPIADGSVLCQEHLEGRYAIEVIDLKLNPSLAADHQILAVPTPSRQLPESIGMVVGNLADTERVLVGLDIAAAPKLR